VAILHHRQVGDVIAGATLDLNQLLQTSRKTIVSFRVGTRICDGCTHCGDLKV